MGRHAIDINGKAVPISTVQQSADKGLLGGALDFANKNPLVTGLGLGLGMSLLQSLMSSSPSAPSNSSQTPSQTGFCTTQYYYTSDSNAPLSDPCALYNPSSATTNTSSGGSNGTDLSSLLDSLSNPANPTLNFTPSSSSSNPTALCPSCTSATSSIVNNSTSLGSTATGTGILFPDLPGSQSAPPGNSASAPVPVSDILTTTVYYTDTTASTTPPGSQTPLNQNPVPQGLHGDLLSFGGGATVYATSNNGNSEVAGFYGTNSSSGAAGLCRSRPWSGNFLSYIIPPAFFDNLCAWAGYPTGAVQTISGAPPQNVSVGGPSAPPPVYSNPVQASAKIWAQPQSVSLGGRTTVFWTSQNVTSCTESSSDGNFTGSSASGGGSTEALSGPVTYTIACNTVDGKTVSDSATVGIGI